MSVTVSEVEWDPDEREKMITLAELERGVHARCGMPLVEVLDPDADQDPETGRLARFVAPKVPYVCAYCAARDDVIQADHEMYGARPHPQALIWPVIDRGRDRPSIFGGPGQGAGVSG